MLRAIMGLRLDLQMGQFDAAWYEGVIHRALQDAGAPIVDVEYDGLDTTDAPLQGPGLGPFEQPNIVRPGALGPPSPFGTRI